MAEVLGRLVARLGSRQQYFVSRWAEQAKGVLSATRSPTYFFQRRRLSALANLHHHHHHHHHHQYERRGHVSNNVSSCCSVHMPMPPTRRGYGCINTLYTQLATHSKAIELSGSQASAASILVTPSQFYASILEGIANAQNRIVLAALYLGSGQKEQHLVDALMQRLHETNGECQVHVLLDSTRGTRGFPSSVSLLAPVVRAFPDSVRVSLFQTPRLRGLTKRLARPPYNEVLSLTHVKACVFDDQLVLSGANLSHDYFTNRQDRYLAFQSKELAGFFVSLVDSIGSVSLQQTVQGVVPRKDGPDPETLPPAEFSSLVQELVLPLCQPGAAGPTLDGTVAFPLIQMAPFDVHQDEQATLELFEQAPEGSRIYLATGYFNLTPKYVRAVLASKAEFHVLTAAPSANGFLGARGIMGHVPAAYTFLEQRFLQAMRLGNAAERVSVHEFSRQDWTFHAKGLWLYMPGDDLPSLSMIGSPNFGHRSAHRDLEAQLALVTNDRAVQLALHEERLRLFGSSERVDEDTLSTPGRQVALWEKLVTMVIKDFF